MSMETHAVDDLLKAEQEANLIIKNAQKERDQKIKQAQISAEQEISIYKREQEQLFNEQIQKKFGQKNDQEVLNRQTEEEIRKIEVDFQRNKDAVVDMLMERIISVQLVIPDVLKANFQ